MTINDLVFILSFLFCAALLLRLAWFSIRGRWPRALVTARHLGIFAGIYASILVGFALLTPRRVLAPGERRCFDDWCIATGMLEHEPATELCAGAPAVWVAGVDVISIARRVRQRAPDAAVELEDAQGRRYPPCSAGAAERIRDYLDAGQSFSVSVPFGVPTGAEPVGLVIHHGTIPGVMIIGDDESWLHQPALLRLK